MALPRPPEYYETPEQPPAPQQPTQPEQPRTLPYEGAVYYPNPMELERWRMQMAQREGYVPTDYTGTDWQRFVPQGWEPRGYRKVWYSFSRDNPNMVLWRTAERYTADPSAPPAIWDTTKTIQNYWHDPQNIIRWYNYLRVQESDYIPEAFVDPDFVKNQYSALKYYNGNLDPDNWKPLPFGEDAAYQTFFQPDIDGVSSYQRYSNLYSTEEMTAALAASQTGASTSELIRVVDKVNADIEKLNQLEQQAKNQEITEQEYNEVAIATLNQYNTDVETLAQISPELANQVAGEVLSPQAAQEWVQKMGTEAVGIPETDEYYLGYKKVSYKELPWWQQAMITLFSPAQRGVETEIEGRPVGSELIGTVAVPALMSGLGWGFAISKASQLIGMALAPFTGGVSIPISFGVSAAIGLAIGAYRGASAYLGQTNALTEQIDKFNTLFNVLDEGTERVIGTTIMAGKELVQPTPEPFDWSAAWKASSMFWETAGVGLGDATFDLLSTVSGGPISETGKTVWDFHRGVPVPVAKEGLSPMGMYDVYNELTQINQKQKAGELSEDEKFAQFDATIAKYIDKYGYSGSMNNFLGQMFVSVQNYLPAFEDMGLSKYADNMAKKAMDANNFVEAQSWKALSNTAKAAIAHQPFTDALPFPIQNIFESIFAGEGMRRISPKTAEFLRGTQNIGKVMEAYRGQVFSGTLIPTGRMYDLPAIEGQPAVRQGVFELNDGRLVVYDPQTKRQTLYRPEDFEATYGKTLQQLEAEGQAKLLRSVNIAEWTRAVDERVAKAQEEYPDNYPGDPDRSAAYIYSPDGKRIGEGRINLDQVRDNKPFYELNQIEDDQVVTWTIRKADDVAVSKKYADGTVVDLQDTLPRVSLQERSIFKVSEYYADMPLPKELQTATDEERMLYNDLASMLGEKPIWQSIVQLDANMRDRKLEITPSPNSKIGQLFYKLADLTPVAKAERMERILSEVLLEAQVIAKHDFETTYRIIKYLGGADVGEVDELAKKLAASPMVKSVYEGLSGFVKQGGKLDDILVQWRASARNRATVLTMADEIGVKAEDMLGMKDADILQKLKAAAPDRWGESTEADVKRLLSAFRGKDALALYDNEAIANTYVKMIEHLDKVAIEKYGIKPKPTALRFTELLKQLLAMGVITYSPKAWINNFLSNEMVMNMFIGNDVIRTATAAVKYLKSAGVEDARLYLLGDEVGFQKNLTGLGKSLSKALDNKNDWITKTKKGISRFQDLTRVGKAYGRIENNARLKAYAGAFAEGSRAPISQAKPDLVAKMKAAGATDEQIKAWQFAAQNATTPEGVIDALNGKIEYNQVSFDSIAKVINDMAGGDPNKVLIINDLMDKYGLREDLLARLPDIKDRASADAVKEYIYYKGLEGFKAGQANAIINRVNEIRSSQEGMLGLLYLSNELDARRLNMQYSINERWETVLNKMTELIQKDGDYEGAKRLYESTREITDFQYESEYNFRVSTLAAAMEQAGNDDFGNRFKVLMEKQFNNERTYFDDTRAIREKHSSPEAEEDIRIPLYQEINQRTAEFRRVESDLRRQMAELFSEMAAASGRTFNGLSGDQLHAKTTAFMRKQMSRMDEFENNTDNFYRSIENITDPAQRANLSHQFYEDVYRPALAEIRDSYKREAFDAYWNAPTEAEPVKVAPRVERTNVDQAIDNVKAAIAEDNVRAKAAAAEQFAISQTDGVLARQQVHDALKAAIIGGADAMYHGRSKLNSLIACLDATAEVYAKLTGKPAESFYSDNFAEINIYHKDAFNRAGEIVRGGTRFDALFDGKAIINFAEARDFTTAFHEVAHVYAGMLERLWLEGFNQDFEIVARTYGGISGDEFANIFESVKDLWTKPRAEWTADEQQKYQTFTDINERFAKGLEEYFMRERRQFVSQPLQAAFNRVGIFLKQLFRQLGRNRIVLSDEMKGVYKRLYELDLPEENVLANGRKIEPQNPLIDLHTPDEVLQPSEKIVNQVKQEVADNLGIKPPEEPVEEQLPAAPVEAKDLEILTKSIEKAPEPEPEIKPVEPEVRQSLHKKMVSSVESISKLKASKADAEQSRAFVDGRQLKGYINQKLNLLNDLIESWPTDQTMVAKAIEVIKSDPLYSALIKSEYGKQVDAMLDEMAGKKVEITDRNLTTRLDLAALEQVHALFDAYDQTNRKLTVSPGEPEIAKAQLALFQLKFNSAYTALDYGKPEMALDVIHNDIYKDAYFKEFTSTKVGERYLRNLQAFESQLNHYYDAKLSKVSSEIGNAKYKAVKTDIEKTAKEIDRNFGQDWKASINDQGRIMSIDYALKEYQKLINSSENLKDPARINEALSVAVAGAMKLLETVSDLDLKPAVDSINKKLNEWEYQRALSAGRDEEIGKQVEAAKSIPDNTDKFDELTALLTEAIALRDAALADPTAEKNADFIKRLDDAIREGEQALPKGGDEQIERTLTALTRERTKSYNFKKWFGASKVVDENGNPLIIYYYPHTFLEDWRFTPDIERAAHAIRDRRAYAFYAKIENPFDLGEPIDAVVKTDGAKEFIKQWGPYEASDAEIEKLYGEYFANNKTNGDFFEACRKFYMEQSGRQLADWRFIDSFRQIIAPYGNYDGINGKEFWYPFKSVKSAYNPGTWSIHDNNLLYQSVIDENAQQPPLPYEPRQAQAIGDTPPGESQRNPNVSDAWGELTYSELWPVLDRAVEYYYDARNDARTITFEGIPDAVRDPLMKQAGIWQQDVASRRAWSIDYAKAQTDHALLNYSEKRGVDMLLQTIFPFQFWYTQSMMEWARQIALEPRILSWWAKRKELARRTGTHNLPSRFAGRYQILARWLPEWAGDSIWINPWTNMFGPVTLSQPISNLQYMSKSSSQAAKRLLQDKMRQGIITQDQYNEAVTKGGALWLDALMEARQNSGEEVDPMSMVSTFMQPAPWFTIPYYLVNYWQGDKTAAEKITPMPLQLYGNAISGQFPEGPLRVVGDIISTIGGEPFQKWIGNDEWGYLTDYYINSRIAEMVVTDGINPEDAELAMIEQKGPIYDEARRRTNEILSYRYPGSALAQVIQKVQEDKNANWMMYLPSAFVATLFPAGIFPPGEMEERGLSDDFSDAYRQFLMGDNEALEEFYNENPEYGIRQSLFKDPDQRLKGWLINNIWDSYMALPQANRSLLKSELGEDFETYFVNKETRNYDEVDVDTMVQWARKLKAKVPETPETEASLGETITEPRLYRPEVAQAAQQWYDYVNQKYPDYYWLEDVYYSLPENERNMFLMKNPQLEMYWHEKEYARQQNPLLDAYFTDRSERYIDVDEELLVPQEKALVEANISKLDDQLGIAIGLYMYSGQKISGGAEAELRRIWKSYGAPGDFWTWLDAYLGIKR